MNMRLTFALILSLGYAITSFTMDEDNNWFENPEVIAALNAMEQNEKIQKAASDTNDDDNDSEIPATQDPLTPEQQAPLSPKTKKLHEKFYDEYKQSVGMLAKTLTNAPNTPQKRHINAIQDVLKATQDHLRTRIKIDSPKKTGSSSKKSGPLRPGTDPKNMHRASTDHLIGIAQRLAIPTENYNALLATTDNLRKTYKEVSHSEALKKSPGSLYNYFQPNLIAPVSNNNNVSNSNNQIPRRVPEPKTLFNNNKENKNTTTTTARGNLTNYFEPTNTTVSNNNNQSTSGARRVPVAGAFANAHNNITRNNDDDDDNDNDDNNYPHINNPNTLLNQPYFSTSLESQQAIDNGAIIISKQAPQNDSNSNNNNNQRS